jgi:hypothetical protein
LEHSFNKSSHSLAISIENLNENISDILQEVKSTVKYNCSKVENKNNTSGLASSINQAVSHFDQFKGIFDNALTHYSTTSLRWIELSKIRGDISKQLSITNEEFYSLVEQLTKQYPDKYELSSGGQEGLTIRGLLHGLVRRIE